MAVQKRRRTFKDFLDTAPTAVVDTINNVVGANNLKRSVIPEAIKPENQARQQQPVQPIATPSTPTASAKNDTATPPKQVQPQIIRDSDTGKVTGIQLPDGRVFMGSPKMVNEMSNDWNMSNAAPAGTVEASKVAQENQAFAQEQERIVQAQEIAGMAGQVGQTPTLPMEQETGVDFGQAARAGFGNIIPSLVGGAAGGAAIGGLASGGTLAIPGALVGAIGGLITGFVSGAKSEMRQQLNGEISTTTTDLSTIQRNMKALITDVNQNPQNAAEDIEMFNYQLALADQQYSKLKRQTQNSLNDYLDVKTRVQMEKFEMFYSRGGTRERAIQSLQVSLLSPNPNKIDLSVDDLGDMEI